MTWKCAIAGVAAAMAFAPGAAQADSLGAIENARAKERQGAYLTRQDREQLRRYGGNDDYGPRYGYGAYEYDGGYYADDHDYDYGPGYYAYPGYPY